MDGLVPASKGKRFAAGLIDLVLIPIVLGIAIGFVLATAPNTISSIVLIVVNVAWLVFRDTVYSPGRALIKTKLVSLTGEKVTIIQAVIRNILLVIPFILVIGYILEIIMLLVKGQRLEDSWAKTQVVEA